MPRRRRKRSLAGARLPVVAATLVAVIVLAVVGRAVVRDFRIEWAKGYGRADVDAPRRVTVRTLYEPGTMPGSRLRQWSDTSSGLHFHTRSMNLLEKQCLSALRSGRSRNG